MPNWRPGIVLRKDLWELQVEQFQAGMVTELVKVATDGRHQRRQVRAHVLKGKREHHVGALIAERLRSVLGMERDNKAESSNIVSRDLRHRSAAIASTMT